MVRKVFASMIAAIVALGVAAAEENGAFVGVEIGSVGINGTAKGTDSGLGSNVWDVKFPLTSAIYGVKAGYKHFFTSNIGIRGYVGLNYTSDSNQSFGGRVVAGDTANAINPEITGTQSVDYSNFVTTANVDVLFNFYNNEQTSYGAFVGIGLGYSNTNAKSKDLVANIAYLLYGAGATGFEEFNVKMNGFYADTKVGLRASSGHNGVDLFVVIPFTKNSTKFNGVDIAFKQNYRIMLAYSYTF